MDSFVTVSQAFNTYLRFPLIYTKLATLVTKADEGKSRINLTKMATLVTIGGELGTSLDSL